MSKPREPKTDEDCKCRCTARCGIRAEELLTNCSVGHTGREKSRKERPEL